MIARIGPVTETQYTGTDQRVRLPQPLIPTVNTNAHQRGCLEPRPAQGPGDDACTRART